MSFEAPIRLLALVVPLVLASWYLGGYARRERHDVTFSSLGLATSPGTGPGWRRHLPAAVALLAMMALVVAFARPLLAVPVPVDEASIVVAVDVSLSMGAEDVEPTRIEAAKAAAVEFVELAPSTLRIGLVAFAGTALPVTAPTTDHALVKEGITRFGLGQGTAVGEAIFSSVDAITANSPELGAPAAIVVLSDGETTMGRSELDGASRAGQIGVPVYTVAFGTRSGSILVEGERVPVPVNEGALAQVADQTGGRFFRAASQAELASVFDDIESQIAFEVEERPVGDWVTAVGLLLLAVAAGLSIRWFDRIA